MSGYFSDDSINSYTNGMVQEKQVSVLQFSKDIMFSWIQSGRFFPLAFYYFYLYNTITSLLLYKLSIILIILINEFVFSLLLFKLTKSRFFSICSLIIPPLLFQFRMYHDPILSFHWLEQLIFLLTITSLILFHSFLKVKNKLYYVCSLLLFLLSLLIYEVAYSFVFLFIIITFINVKTKLLRGLYYVMPYILSVLSCIIISIFLRIHFNVALQNSGNDGAYVPNYNLFDYFATLFKQSISSFPLNYLIFDPHKLFSVTNISDLLTWNNLFLIIMFIIFFLLLRSIIDDEKQVLKNIKLYYKNIIFFGLSLIVLPGLLISLSPRYQKEVVLGIGYIPVYISYYGTSILIVFLIMGIVILKKKITNNLMIAIALIIGIIVSINNTNNILVVEKLNEHYLYPRQVIQEALANGLYDNAATIDSIVVSTNNSWDVPAFYIMYTHKIINSVITPNSLKVLKNTNSLDLTGNNYYLDYYSDNKFNGYSITGKIVDLPKSSSQLNGILTENITLYVKNYKEARNKIVLNVTSFDLKTNKMESFRINAKDLHLIAGGEKYGLYSLFETGKLYDIKSTNISYENNDSELPIFEKEKIFPSSSDKDILHLSIMKNNSPYISFDKAINFGKDYSIELLVKPYGNEVPYSSIIGNHPGASGHEGFVIQRINTTDFYNFTFGDGKKWINSKPFLLDMDIWNYIVVVSNNNNLDVYKNGELISHEEVDGNIVNSSIPLYLYNWVHLDRKFNGIIDEFRISNEVKTDKTIQETWRNIQKK